MITFIISLVALVLGYLVYGAVMDRVMRPDDRETPAARLADGVDYVVLPTWKVFMIQFLNIAGTGPIFGAIMGMWFGPASYLWIVLGCIFAGAVHDFMSGMLSLRHDGANLPTLIGKYLGGSARNVMLVFTVMLLLMVGAVFVYSPALILSGMWGKPIVWIIVIFCYYIIATLLPIDKIIGRIYPLFAIALLVMAAGLLVGLFIKMPHLPELWNMGDMSQWTQSQIVNGKDTLGIAAYLQKNPTFPCLFITIACGAISGFHATQSPLMARCMKSEKQGRPIFYGAMITEGIVALIWATVAMYFFYNQPTPGYAELPGAAVSDGAPSIVNTICNSWLGTFGGILAILGVVAAPITSGDTALRSCRLIIADFIKLSQKTIRKRFYICIPLFAAVIALVLWDMNEDLKAQQIPGYVSGFEKLWSWFGWSNQTLSVFMLWAITVFLVQQRKPYIITLIPALFMTVVCTTFFVSVQAFSMPEAQANIVAGATFVVALAWFFLWMRKYKHSVTQ